MQPQKLNVNCGLSFRYVRFISHHPAKQTSKGKECDKDLVPPRRRRVLHCGSVECSMTCTYSIKVRVLYKAQQLLVISSTQFAD